MGTLSEYVTYHTPQPRLLPVRDLAAFTELVERHKVSHIDPNAQLLARDLLSFTLQHVNLAIHASP